MTPDLLLLLLRFLRFALAMLLFGGGLYVCAIAPASLRHRLTTRLEQAPVALAASLILVLLLRLPLLAASLGDGWPDMARRETLAAVLATWTGTGWLIDAALGLLLATSLLTGRHRWPLLTSIAGLVLIASVLTGHAAIGDGAWSLAHQISDALHLLAAGFWLGALPPLALTLRNEGAGPDTVAAVKRFAVAGQLAVTVILATGIANAILIKGGAPLHWSSAYDLLLLAKIAVVLGMIGLAAFNHTRLLPRLAAGSNRAAHALRRTVLIELALGAGAVGLVSVFGTMDMG